MDPAAQVTHPDQSTTTIYTRN